MSVLLPALSAPQDLVEAAIAGILLSLVHFGGLWLITRRLARMRRPGLTLAVSGALRLVILLALMLWLSGGKWDLLIACVAGLTLGRVLLTALVARGTAPVEGRRL